MDILTERKFGEFQFNITTREVRFVSEDGRTTKWKDASTEYVFTLEEWFNEVKIPPELLPYLEGFIEFLKGYFEQVGKGNQIPLNREGCQFDLIKILPRALNDFIADEVSEIKNLKHEYYNPGKIGETKPNISNEKDE